MAQFASKTLAERNNDPVVYGTDLNGDEDPTVIIAPRPEYQHGKLEANPILVALRDSDSTISVGEALEAVELAEYWNGLPDEKDHDPEWSVDQVAHAHRVLTLWLAVYQ